MNLVNLDRLIRPAAVRRAGGDSDFPILSMTMHEGLVDQATKFKKRIASLDTSSYKVVAKGQLVVGFPIDEAVLSFQNLYSEAIVSPAYAVWDVDDSLVDRQYLERFLRGPRAIEYYKSKLRGSTARRRSLPNPIFLAMEVPLPPLPEQRRIADILDRADDLRVQRRRSLALADRARLAILEQLLSGAQTTVVRLGDLVEEFRYGTSVKSGAAGLPVLRIPNVSKRRLNLDDLKYVKLEEKEVDRLALAEGDLLIVRSNGNPELVGATVRFHNAVGDQKFVFASYLIRARLREPRSSLFIEQYLASPAGRASLRSGARTSAGQYNINTKSLGEISIPLPDRAALLDFAARVARVEAIRERHLGHLAKLDELFASLQHRAFQGEF